jgi:integrase
LLRRIIEAKLAEGLSSTTVRLLVLQVSGLFSDLVEQGHAPHNPVRLLPRATRRLIRPAHDPRTTPFLERKADVRRVYLGLPEPINVAFALGAFAGLRRGETLGLRWEHVDLVARRIHVRESVGGPLKDDESRVVPILDSLLAVLNACAGPS